MFYHYFRISVQSWLTTHESILFLRNTPNFGDNAACPSYCTQWQLLYTHRTRLSLCPALCVTMSAEASGANVIAGGLFPRFRTFVRIMQKDNV